MGVRFTTTETNAMYNLLKRVPREASGALPFAEWKGTSEWQTLMKAHSENSIKAKMHKTWKESVIEAKPKDEPNKLNHAYNFCPGCGRPLN